LGYYLVLEQYRTLKSGAFGILIDNKTIQSYLPSYLATDPTLAIVKRVEQQTIMIDIKGL